MDREKIAEVVEKAADLIETNGLAKGRYFALDGGMCTMGALQYACGVDLHSNLVIYPKGSRLRNRQDLYMSAKDAVAQMLPISTEFGTIEAISNWNDDGDRSQEEVVDTLKHIAKDLRNSA